jgi:polyisoprenoid-binding protein YceI
MAADAQERSIDKAKSVITVRVFKTGVFSALGHDHEIAAPVDSGSVNSIGRSVQVRVRTAALRVHDPNASAKDREEIRKTMLGPDVLDAERFPEIVFRSTTAEPSGSNGAWAIHGDLTLHGQTRPIAFEVRDQAGHYVGSTQLKQTDFGIKPVRIAGGTVKVKDEVGIEFNVQLAQ